MSFDKNQIFEIKEEHLKILQNACVSWNDIEYGAASIDPKYPYGESGVYRGIGPILNIPFKDEDYKEYDEKDEEYMDTLHIEMKVVLEIGFHTLSFEKGWYSKIEYGGSPWRKVESESELNELLNDKDTKSVHQLLKENRY